MMKIKSVLFVKDLNPFGFEGGEVNVYGVMEDDTQQHLFRYYSDELSFSSGELVGLTSEQARALFVKKDTAYLQS